MQNLNGIVMVVAAMAAFTLEDTFIKLLSADFAISQILFGIGLGGAVVFAAIATAQRRSLFAPLAWTRFPLLRALSEMLAALAFVTALSRVDISIVAAVFQATPLAITLGAALFFREQVGWRRWCAILLGFLGVLMIIRPGFDDFNPASLYVLLTVVTIAARDLLTRKVPGDVASSIVSFQGFASLVVVGVLMRITLPDMEFRAMDQGAGLLLLGAVIFGTLGYYGIVTAMRVADASAVTPFRYTRLVFSLIVGMVVFQERPDLWTLLGAGLIIATGLYTFLRERKLALEIANRRGTRRD
ncbi:MAG: EamA family transporter [Rhodobacterales bacterium]|nr:MAG: EamA family transporter [Rhodobacterales bacterium]